MDVADPSGGTAAVGGFAFTAGATGPGTSVWYLGGERYAIGVAAGDTPATMAAAAVAVINQGYVKFGRRMNAPVTAAVDGAVAGKVVLTFNHTGTEGNGFRIERVSTATRSTRPASP